MSFPLAVFILPHNYNYVRALNVVSIQLPEFSLNSCRGVNFMKILDRLIGFCYNNCIR